ncbi:DUF2147 domain-containing protein [Profundibacterium mesophilum]|uniref:DUF2147 domain-containing protein n=1 Tax=Profundibacterium mesophilum KAUST100406-0324 TaxID=1037889 RepID=A0A921TCV8_9RHOB|nr:DUF2147 domain-containing protein [Profundibacterium mesophilum]KAF0677595.1 uncharacterized protein PMES_00100 [Profundibacterium mesophilum KAUST100406-0324]
MKTLILAAAAAISMAAAAWADPVEGIWQTEADDGAFAHVSMAPCGGAICGTIARTFNAAGEYRSENIGKPLVWNMVQQKPGKYGDGKIWQPSTGKTYRSKMTLEGNVLKVSGCIGPICKKQTWRRVQ